MSIKRNTLLIGLSAWLGAASAWSGQAASVSARNVVLVTLDGLRWQEVFSGADPTLLNKAHGGVSDTNQIRQRFWRITPEERRKALLPFLWDVMARQGQILGNTNRGSIVKVANGLNFSYPGYNELLTGSPDPRIDSNDKTNNPNLNVLEWLNRRPEFSGRVAAFCAWDVFPFILNEGRSKLPVWVGGKLPQTRVSQRAAFLERITADTTRVWDTVLLDSFVYHAAADYLELRRPRVLYIAFGETDDWAHDGRYDRVLMAAHQTDDYLRRLWQTLQGAPQYRGRTTLLVTTDHGRGSGLEAWRSHGKSTEGSEYIWVAALGPGITPRGERAGGPPMLQAQVAATVATLLGQDFRSANPNAAPPLAALFE